MTVLQAAILGIIQGLTEFLPVSSSGHLVIFQHLFGLKEVPVTFDVFLHVGTLFSIFLVYGEDIWGLIVAFFSLLSDLVRGRKRNLLRDSNRKFAVMIIVASIPTALMGIVFKPFFESFFSSLRAVGFFLLLTGILLWVGNKMIHGRKRVEHMNVFDALCIGIFQGLAISPGLSRSGSTIFAALIRGLEPATATRFSFLVSIPTILGAAILSFKNVMDTGAAPLPFLPTLVGFFAAALTGILAIKVLINLLQRGRLNIFSWYTWLVGLLVIGAGFLG